jgi:hypothetical protein
MRLVRTIGAFVAGLILALAAQPAGAATAQSTPTLVAVRAGHHLGFDRVVFEFRDGLPSYTVRPVDQLVEDGSGRPVELAGTANLEVVFHGANAHDGSGRPTVSPRRFSPGLTTVKEVAQIGDFEAVVSYGLGLDHQAPFKLLELSNPPRLVVDVSTSGQAPAGGAGELPFTGSPDLGLLLTGLGLVAAGATALALGRRTRTP